MRFNLPRSLMTALGAGLVCHFVLTSTSFAAESSDTFSALKFRPHKTPTAKAGRELEKISKFMESKNLFDLSKALGKFRERFGFRQIFASDDLSRAVFLRYDLDPVAGTEEASIVDDGKGGLVARGKTGLGTPYTALFIGYSKVGINTLLIGLHGSRSSAALDPRARRAPPPPGLVDAVTLILRSRIARAENAEPGAPVTLPVPTPTPFAPGAIEDEDDPPSTCKPNSFLRGNVAKVLRDHGSDCLVDMAFGAFGVLGAATFGAAGVAFEAAAVAGQSRAKNFVGSIIDGTFLTKAKEGWESWKESIVSLRRVLSDKYRGFMLLAPKKQEEVVCKFAGLALTAAPALYLSQGAALPMTYVSVTTILESVDQSLDFAAELKSLKKQCPRPPRTATAPNEAKGEGEGHILEGPPAEGGAAPLPKQPVSR